MMKCPENAEQAPEKSAQEGGFMKKAIEYRKYRDYTPFLMMLPAIVILCCVILYPIVNSVNMSLQYYVMSRIKHRNYIGLQNYINTVADPAFGTALLNSLRWILLVVPFQFIAGLILALLLNRPFKGNGIIRSLTMIPWVTSGVIIALIWSWIYNGNFGVLNDILRRIGLISNNIAWLSNPKTALNCQIVTMIWQGIPFFAVMLLAAIQSIPTELYEAGDVEGVNTFQKFYYITLPYLIPTIKITSMLRFIWVANNVDIIYQMTQGGPGYSSLTLSVYAYIKAQKSMDFGYASTLAVYGIIFMLPLMFLYIKMLNGKEK